MRYALHFTTLPFLYGNTHSRDGEQQLGCVTFRVEARSFLVFDAGGLRNIWRAAVTFFPPELGTAVLLEYCSCTWAGW